MAGSRIHKPRFWWQAGLILLPVIVLALVGLYSLRQDRLLAEREAQERAQNAANELLPRLAQVITNEFDRSEITFRVKENGELSAPVDYPRVPEPQPLDLNALNQDQTALWSRMQSVATATEREQLGREFLSLNPPERFVAIASTALALSLAEQGEAEKAADLLDVVAERHSGVVGESGLPIGTLAAFRRFELTSQVSPEKIDLRALDLLCSNLVHRPTLLTPYLLDRLHRFSGERRRESGSGRAELERVSHWIQRWQEEERGRRLFRAAQVHLQRQALLARQSLRVSAGAGDSYEEPDLDPRVSVEKKNGFMWINVPEGMELTMTNSGIQGGGNPDLSVIRLTEWNWLATQSSEEEGGIRFQCVSDVALSRALAKAIGSYAVPDYLAVEVHMAGRRLSGLAPDLRLWHSVRQGGKEGFTTKAFSDTLASAPLAAAGADSLMRLNIYLTSPTEIFQRQQARTFWFTTLVLVSAVAALIGLAAAWRVFRQQEHLNEMKSNFVSSVSHELRTPIASVRLMAESLERGKIPGPDKQNEYFRFIGQECRRLSSLIENVLDFSRIEQGRKEYEFEPTDLVALMRETVKLMEPYAAERKVRLEVGMPDAKGGTSNVQDPTLNIEVEADGRAIQQALVNLIDNAIKHSPEGETVTVGLASQHPGSDGDQPSTVSISVADRGPGIPLEEQEKIFELFYRLGSELRRETQGVGIGLSIVRHVAEAHGGRVIVESNPGHGSRFTITIPRKHSAIRNLKSEI